MSLDSYTNLKTEIADWLDRPDLTARIDTFIDLAEAKHIRELRIRAMLKRAAAVTTTATKYLALPTGYLGMRTIRLNTDPITVLVQRSEYEMTRVAKTSPGKPLYFSVHEEIEFDRVPDAAYSAEMIYYAKLSPLSDSVATNWLLTNAPDAYLYGALLAVEPFLDNDERIPTWQGLYNQCISDLNDADRKSRTSGPQVAQPAGAVV